jgi:hypothetical protein
MKDQERTMSCQVMTAASGQQGAKSRRHGIRSATLGGPYGRGRSEFFRSNEETAQGPASSCRTTQRAEGTDPRRLWIPEEVGCCLQKGVPLCSSGTVQEKPLQGNCGPRKELAAAGRMTTHSTKVTWCRRHDRKRYD